jgi:hypothetical protein
MARIASPLASIPYLHFNAAKGIYDITSLNYEKLNPLHEEILRNYYRYQGDLIGLVCCCID